MHSTRQCPAAPPRCCTGWRILSAVVQISHALTTISQERADVPRQEKGGEGGLKEREVAGRERERRRRAEGKRERHKERKEKEDRSAFIGRFLIFMFLMQWKCFIFVHACISCVYVSISCVYVSCVSTAQLE